VEKRITLRPLLRPTCEFNRMQQNVLLRATAGTAKRVLAIVILSVWLSWCHNPVPIQSQVRQRLPVFTVW